uniref:Protein phosphatase 1 regulatory subunit 37 n=1 Tax=Takifugu rubripes TaxID=31033 RepID=A0A3B5K7I4_TAKRU
MNIEEPGLDLCHVKTKNNVNVDQNPTSNTEAVTPRIPVLMMDTNSDKQHLVPIEASETYLMPQLTDNLQVAEEANHQEPNTLEIDELNGNQKGDIQASSEVVKSTDLIISNDEQHKDNIVIEKIKDDTEPAVDEGEDGGDMDIGVDLSLDESGVLETESTNVTTSASGDDLTQEPTSRDAPSAAVTDQLPDLSPAGSTEASAPDQAGLYPVVEESGDKHKPSGKRVTFPSDEDIVSGAVEPKDPWRHAHNVTIEEILSSYKQACQKLNCKPIPKVLKQIQDLNDLTQRNECLDLKGEKLDYKACESLEEILKRVQFKVIDLEQTNLDEDGASALFDMIEYYESATHLNISFNKHIGARGWQAAAHMMRKTSSLQYLDARNTPLLDHSAPFVARALRISGSLAVLHLENAGLSGRPLMLLATALKMNMNLRELYLADNKLNGLQDSAQLGNLLKFNYNIQILDLRNNHILDSGLAYVCEGLKEQRKGLVTLVLWNNQLTHNGMGYLAAALPCTQSLETLNLGHNSVGNEGVHKLKDGLISNRSVLRLGLASTKLSCEGAVAVAEFIADSPRLLRLDLRENEIKTGGLMALSLALKVNTSLLRLDLDREPKKETVKSFIETQRALLAEIQNGCKRNFILAKEKEETEQKMRLSASMAEIATEDGTREEEEEPVAEENKESKQEEDEGQSTCKSESSEETSVSPTNLESDSDTEEEEEEVVTNSSAPASASADLKQTPPEIQKGVTQPLLSASHTSSSPSVLSAKGLTVIPGITVTETTPPPGTPPSPGRCISVSSPGRGRKIFMVTRVESPPEQQQLQQQASVSAPPSQTTEDSKTPVEVKTPTTQQTESEHLSQTPTQAQQIQEGVMENSPAPSSDSQARAHGPSRTHTLQPQSADQPMVDVETSTLDPNETNPSQQAPSQPSDSSPTQLTEEATEREENLKDTEQISADGTEGAEILSQDQGHIHDAEAQQQPFRSAHEGLQSELVPTAEEILTANQTEEETEVQGGAQDRLSETAQCRLIKTSQEKICPNQQNGINKEAVGAVMTQQQTSPTAPSTAQESNPSEGEDSTMADLEDSPSSSADECECSSEALEDVIGSALPNGLKAEFSLHLLETESPKSGSCMMDHGELVPPPCSHH